MMMGRRDSDLLVPCVKFEGVPLSMRAAVTKGALLLMGAVVARELAL